MRKIYPIIFVLSLFSAFHIGFAQTTPNLDLNNYSVDIKANGFDGSPSQPDIKIPYNGSLSLSWTSKWPSNYPEPSCSGRNNVGEAVDTSWQGPKPANGQATITGLTASNIYTIECFVQGQRAAVDSVTFNIGARPSSPATLDLKANGSNGPLTVPPGSDVLLSWEFVYPGDNHNGPTSNSTQVGRCEPSGSWGRGDLRNDIGQEFTGPLTSGKVYKLTCGSVSFDANGIRVDKILVDTVIIYVSDSAVPVPTIAACDSTSQAVVTAAGGCDKIDSSLYKNVYAACCTAITKESLLQTLDAALADGVLDKSEKLSLLNALDTYLSRL